MGPGLDYFTDEDIFQSFAEPLDSLDLKAGHSHEIGELMDLKIDIDKIRQPLYGRFHISYVLPSIDHGKAVEVSPCSVFPVNGETGNGQVTKRAA
jgi:hypothetical protein